MKNKIVASLLSCGILTPFLFWTATLLAGNIHGNYNHLRDTISELGAIGTSSAHLMAVFTWLCTALGLLFFTGLFIMCKSFNLNKLPLLGVLGFSLMFAWASYFPSGNPLHGKSGPLLLLLLSGPILTVICWKNTSLKNLRKMSSISFLAMLLIIIRAIPSETIQYHYTGLIQRFVHVGWSIWFISLTLTFIKLLPHEK